MYVPACFLSVSSFTCRISVSFSFSDVASSNNLQKKKQDSDSLRTKSQVSIITVTIINIVDNHKPQSHKTILTILRNSKSFDKGSQASHD